MQHWPFECVLFMENTRYYKIYLLKEILRTVGSTDGAIQELARLHVYKSTESPPVYVTKVKVEDFIQSENFQQANGTIIDNILSSTIVELRLCSIMLCCILLRCFSVVVYMSQRRFSVQCALPFECLAYSVFWFGISNIVTPYITQHNTRAYECQSAVQASPL